ncbi:hypothetical protein J1614_010778 [Plenodomus biglobosus]|nr:hypothetical protein J1614_010778 [Plenodomus biglobosus]
MIAIHKHGWTKRIYDPDRRDLIQKTMFFTFEDRYEAIREYFKISKTICADILKGERFWSLLGNPVELMKRARMNERQNKNKRARLNWAVAAEKAEKQQKRAREEEEGVGEEARPSKKVREA